MYRQSLLGYVWILLPPLFTSLIWIFLNDQQLVVGDTGGAAAPMFILTGTVLWTAFNTAVIGMQGIMGEARSVLSKINFPHEALIISAFLKTVMNALLPALILIPAALTYGIEVGTSACLFPLGFLTLLLSGAAIGLFLVPVRRLALALDRLFVRDLGRRGLELDPLRVLEALEHDPQVQLAESAEHGLPRSP